MVILQPMGPVMVVDDVSAPGAPRGPQYDGQILGFR
jgi:hypothetical protein